MKATGIVRRIDPLGRIVMPIELRRTLHINTNDQLEFFIEEDTVILKKRGFICEFCNNENEILDFNGHCVCRECIKKMANML